MKIVKKGILDVGEKEVLKLVELHMQEIIENMNDLSTDPKARRTLTITLAFKTDEERENVFMESKVVPKLAAKKARGVQFRNVSELHRPTGEMVNVFREVTSEIPGQMSLDGTITEPEVSIIGAYADAVINRAINGHNAITQDDKDKLKSENTVIGGHLQ